MAKRLLLVKPADRDRKAFRQFLEASGYDVRETTTGSDADPAIGGFEPDLVVIDHEADTEARLALRSALSGDRIRRPIPVVELCLTLPTSFAAAANVLDRVTTNRSARRRSA